MKKPSKKKNTVKDFKHFNPSSDPIIPLTHRKSQGGLTVNVKRDNSFTGKHRVLRSRSF